MMSTKKVMHIVVLLLLLIALFSFFPLFNSGKSGHLTLLTVSTVGNESFGGTADLYLDIKPGTGNIYLATFPFTKLDTQISTRFAKEVACSLVTVDCNQYDFFYTLRADSTIVGGPSAGAALTALTAILLEGKTVDQQIAVTGTINAGGLIGPVGGVVSKVSAAEKEGMHTVIIPRWDQLHENLSDNSFNTSIVVVRASRIDEVISILTNEPYVADVPDLSLPATYTQLMDAIADQLCARSEELLSLLPVNFNNSLYNASINFLSEASIAAAQDEYYSRASYCFSANLRLRELQLDNFSDERLIALAEEVLQKISDEQLVILEKNILSFTDLQTKAIVDERLREAAEYVSLTNVSARDVAYAIERYRSAVIWSSFFSSTEDDVLLDDSHLRIACETKLSEVEERKSYLTALFGFSPLSELHEFDDAYAMYVAGDYALCLFKASKAKAQVDMVISTASLAEEDMSLVIEEKLAVAKLLINREMAHDRFPVMGYSYYEYAGSLRDDDSYAASLFASYALELADLSLYFPHQDNLMTRLKMVLFHPFFFGLLAGILLMLLFIVFNLPDKKSVQKKRARRKH